MPSDRFLWFCAPTALSHGLCRPPATGAEFMLPSGSVARCRTPDPWFGGWKTQSPCGIGLWPSLQGDRCFCGPSPLSTPSSGGSPSHTSCTQILISGSAPESLLQRLGEVLVPDGPVQIPARPSTTCGTLTLPPGSSISSSVKWAVDWSCSSGTAYQHPNQNKGGATCPTLEEGHCQGWGSRHPLQGGSNRLCYSSHPPSLGL